MLGEAGDVSDVALDGAAGRSCGAQVVEEALAKRGHGRSPRGKRKRRERTLSVRGDATPYRQRNRADPSSPVEKDLAPVGGKETGKRGKDEAREPPRSGLVQQLFIQRSIRQRSEISLPITGRFVPLFHRELNVLCDFHSFYTLSSFRDGRRMFAAYPDDPQEWSKGLRTARPPRLSPCV